MKILHVVPGLEEGGNGIAVAARLIAAEQGADLIEARLFAGGDGELDGYGEVWVHSCWLPMTLKSCRRVLRAGKPLVRMMHGNLDPVRLKYHGWMKRLVGPIERWCLRRCDRIVATCAAEKEWIEAYLGKKCPVVEVTDIKRFFDLEGGEAKENWRRGILPRQMGEQGATSVATLTRLEAASPIDSRAIHLLYLGRRHPLKGLEYLEAAVAELNSNSVNSVQKTSTRSTCSPRLKPELRIVSSAYGEELEKVWQWCDVLVLPTLSENFGLVVAEALERGKRVITTDGAPAWEEGLSRVERVEGLTRIPRAKRVAEGDALAGVRRRDAYPPGEACPRSGCPSRGECAEMFSRVEHVERVEGGLWSGYEGRLIYLKGYRDGTDEERVALLKKAMERICK